MYTKNTLVNAGRGMEEIVCVISHTGQLVDAGRGMEEIVCVVSNTTQVEHGRGMEEIVCRESLGSMLSTFPLN